MVEKYISYYILSEHRPNTNIALVGLQTWRGAFLLADFMIYLGLKGGLTDKVILELGGGTGLTSFVAGMYAKKVICTGDYEKLMQFVNIIFQFQ